MAHFIGSIYHVFISGCFSVFFLLLIVGSVLFTAAGYIAYPKCWKYCTLIYLKGFLKALSFKALFHLLLMLSGDIEVNPGPKPGMSVVLLPSLNRSNMYIIVFT